MGSTEGRIAEEVGVLFETGIGDAVRQVLAFVQEQPGAPSVLERERENALGAAAAAYEHQWWRLVVELALSMDRFLEVRGHWTDRKTILERAKVAAQACNDFAGEARIHDQIGTTYFLAGEWNQAIRHY